MALPPEATQAKVKKRKVPLVPVSTGSRGDSADQRPKPSEIKDTKSDADLKRASDFKKTAQYRGAIRASYKAQPLPQRKALVARAGPKGWLDKAGRDSVEAGVIRSEHEGRQRFSQKFASLQHMVDFNNLQQLADAYAAAWKPPKEKEVGGLIGTATGLTTGAVHLGEKIGAKAGPIVGASIFPAIAGTLAGVDKVFGTKTLKTGKEIASNAGRELVDIPANAPASLYYLGKPLVEQPGLKGLEKTLGIAAHPYVEAYHHPGQAIVKHPLSTGLMFGLTPRTLDRAAGKIERTTRDVLGKGAGPYVPTFAKLPGTAAGEYSRPPKGFVGARMMQRSAAKAKAAGNPVRMSDHEINTRVDLLSHMNQTLAKKAEHEAAAAIDKHTWSSMTDAQKREAIGVVGAKARLRGRQETYEHLALRERSGAGKVRTWDDKQEAYKVGQSWYNRMLSQGRNPQALVPVRSINPETGLANGYMLVPALAKNRLEAHMNLWGGHKSVGWTLGQAISGAFRRAVLPWSVKWMNGNVVEGGVVRTPLTHAGPRSMYFGKQVSSALKEQNPRAWDQYKILVAGSGHGGMHGQLLEQAPTYEQQLAGTNLASLGRTLTSWAKRPTPALAARALKKQNNFIFNSVNGKFEEIVHTGMAGKFIKESNLFSKGLLRTSNEAIDAAAKGLQDINVMVHFAKELHKAFGKYGAFSPTTRKLVSTWTPFLAWTLNSIHFVTQHLPADHPLATQLLADASQASEEWRKDHGLAKFMAGAVPDFLQGSVPVGNKKLRLGGMSPFGAWGNILAQQAETFNPLGQTIWLNLALGKDWKGDDLKQKGEFARGMAAAISLIEGTVPMSGLAIDLATHQTTLGKYANPYRPVSNPKAKGKPFKFGSEGGSGDFFGTGKSSNFFGQ